jgi:hypothetical protein
MLCGGVRRMSKAEIEEREGASPRGQWREQAEAASAASLGDLDGIDVQASSVVDSLDEPSEW